MPRSAVRSVLSAVNATLRANPTLMGLLRTDYPIVAGKPPQSPNYPFLRITDFTEGDVALAFEALGKNPKFNIHIWSSKVHDSDEVLQIYEQIELSLNQVTLGLGGQYHLLGSTRLVIVVSDPSGTAIHGVCEYSATVLNA